VLLFSFAKFADKLSVGNVSVRPFWTCVFDKHVTLEVVSGFYLFWSSTRTGSSKFKLESLPNGK
jgi:hypothetical protein